jgi:2,4'-dihydroxyacetophenone dioxygenase
MPITNFSSFAESRNSAAASTDHGHLIANIDLNDENRWVPYADGVWVQPCSFNLSSGSFSLILKALPGASLGVHYHVGSVQGYTLNGHWGYLEYDWTAKPGSFIYEPPGEAHSLVIRDDSPETAMIFFMIQDGLIYLDKPVDGNFAAYEDAFSALELCRAHYGKIGRDLKEIEALVR